MEPEGSEKQGIAYEVEGCFLREGAAVDVDKPTCEQKSGIECAKIGNAEGCVADEEQGNRAC